MVTRNILIALLPIFLILIINFASAIEVNFDYKDGVEIDEEFELEITSDSSDKIYDVKIFVQDAEGKIISEIDNSGWKNPFYYIKSSYPEKSKYKIRIVEYLDDTEICLRLRESTKSNFDEKCQDIEIIKGDYIEDNPSEKFDDVDESDLTSANQSTLLLEKPNEDKIILNTLTNTPAKEEYTSGEWKKILLGFYSLILLTIFVILMSKRKKFY